MTRTINIEYGDNLVDSITVSTIKDMRVLCKHYTSFDSEAQVTGDNCTMTIKLSRPISRSRKGEKTHGIN